MLDNARHTLVESFLLLETMDGDGSVLDYGREFDSCYDAEKDRVVWIHFRACLGRAHAALVRARRRKAKKGSTDTTALGEATLESDTSATPVQGVDDGRIRKLGGAKRRKQCKLDQQDVLGDSN